MESRPSIFSRILVHAGIGLVLLVSLGLFTGGLTSRAAHAQANTTTTITNCSNDSQLQSAVANAASGDTINFGCGGQIPMTHGLTINTSLTLDGSGQNVTLNGNNSVVVLFVNGPIQFTLNAITIIDGKGQSGFSGGLYNNGGNVTISNSGFQNNTGSAVAQLGGSITISNSTFGFNSGDGGGAVYNNGGTVNVSNSVFNNNSVTPVNSVAASGGGIYNSGTLTITASTFIKNSASGSSSSDGGGVYNDGGQASITNSTFFQNSGQAGGGGLASNGGLVNISDSTFDESSPSGLNDNQAEISIANSIVANSTGSNCVSISPSILTDQGYNLSSDTSCGFTASTSQQSANAQLDIGPANNGGPTPTVALLTGSPAIDKIPLAHCATTDQRGMPRPDDNESNCDIGAYESYYPDNDLALAGLPGNMTVTTTSAQGTVVNYTNPTATEESGDNTVPSVSCTPASGSTFPLGTTTVTCTATDSDDINSPVTGTFTVTVAFSSFTVTDCSSDSQLQSAVANAASGATITFGCSGDIKLSKTLTIATDLTLDGSGQNVTLDGNNTVQVLLVNSGVNFTLNALTVAHGSASFNGGGSIVNADGGGLSNNGGTVTIDGSTFTNNTAVQGGALWTQNGTLTITNSTIANNSTPSNSGGGLFIENGTVTVTNSTFANNTASGLGGAIYTHGALSMTNSTIANNSNSVSGGGIYNDSTTSTITSSTIVNNSGGHGGGLTNSNGTINVSESIVANNTGGANCFGGSSDRGYNLSNDTSCGFTAGTSQQGIDPQVASALAENGGPTQTIALLNGSPAIDNIPLAQCPATDQRGSTRPDDPSETACDIGAYESNYPPDSDLALSNVPANMTVAATSAQGAVVTYTTPNATDEAGDTPGPSVTCSPASGTVFPIGTTQVTCTATDSDDTNSPVSASFSVTVTDSDLALSNVPANITVPASSSQGAVVTYTAPTATDEDGSAPTVSCSPASGSTFAIGTTTVTCTASDSDDSNSPATASFTVTVNDTDLGITNVPANITVNATSAHGAVVTYTAPSATDEGGETPSVSCTPASGSTFAIGTTQVTCTATDRDDTPSTVSGSFTVTVNDTDLGLSNMPANITTNATSTQGATVTYTSPTVVDEDSPLPTVGCTPTSGSIFPIGTTKVTCTVTDSDDTPSTVSQSFTVTVNPVLAATGTSVKAQEAAVFSGVVATGSAYGTANPLSATFTWGDGSSSAGTVTLNADGSYSVAGSHTYAEEGTYAISVAVSDSGVLHTSASSTATVSDAPLTLKTFSAAGGGHLTASVSGLFSDADPAGTLTDYTVTVQWGDGTTSTLKIVHNPQGFAFSGTHSYPAKGIYTITLTITDAGGSKITQTVSVTIK